MKKIISLLVIITVASNFIVAQNVAGNLPLSTAIIPYKLEVGYNTTTVIIFPVPLVPAADRGNHDIIVQQEKLLDNVLKVKGAKNDFKPTNLHVYTVDGKLYVFNVTYTEYPGYTTFNLNKLLGDSMASGPLVVDRKIAKESHLTETARKSREARQFISKAIQEYDIRLQLRSIHITSDWLVFGFRLSNLSNLNYDIDFVRFYMKDKKQVKRSSIQEQEISPLYIDPLTTIPGQQRDRFVIVVPKFTIPDKKVFFIELFEKNGGRHLTLQIKNKYLLKAKAL
jgi:conjugative transposon TraN protein